MSSSKSQDTPSMSAKTEVSAKKVAEFTPCTLFVYGSLMDPDVLMSVVGLKREPELQDASIDGFEMRLWNGIYPTLLPSESSQARIQGKAWQVTNADQCVKLQHYETSAYEIADCSIQLEGGRVVKGLTFKWARRADSEELQDGTFNLEDWQAVFKPLTFRRQDVS